MAKKIVKQSYFTNLSLMKIDLFLIKCVLYNYLNEAHIQMWIVAY